MNCVDQTELNQDKRFKLIAKSKRMTNINNDELEDYM